MAFYIRKAFKAGPLRFNLSKGGIGVSAGVTGARIGLNRRGAYIHGGRHGLYFREQIKLKKSPRKSARTESVLPGGFAPASVGAERVDANRQTSFIDPAGTTSLYIDTGVLYPSVYADIPTPVWPDFDPMPNWYPGSRNLWIAMFGLFVVGSFFFVAIFLPLLALSGMYLGRRYLRHTANLKAAAHFSRRFMRWMEHPQDAAQAILDELKDYQEKSDEDYERYFVPLWYSRLIDRMMALAAGLAGVSSVEQAGLGASEVPSSRRKVTKENLQLSWDELCRQFPLVEAQMACVKPVQDMLKVAMLNDALERTLDDHMLSRQEEAYLQEVVRILDIRAEDAAPMLQMVDLAARIRDAVEAPLMGEDSPVELTRGEQCVGVYPGVRLLREKVLKRYQRDRTTVRELGFTIELEGDLILTDKRILLHTARTTAGTTTRINTRNTATPAAILTNDQTTALTTARSTIREFRLNRFTDVVTDPGRNLLELFFSDRQNPVYLTSPDSIVLASRLEKLMEMSHRNLDS
jgi:hypothetical protein